MVQCLECSFRGSWFAEYRRAEFGVQCSAGFEEQRWCAVVGAELLCRFIGAVLIA